MRNFSQFIVPKGKNIFPRSVDSCAGGRRAPGRRIKIQKHYIILNCLYYVKRHKFIKPNKRINSNKSFSAESDFHHMCALTVHKDSPIQAFSVAHTFHRCLRETIICQYIPDLVDSGDSTDAEFSLPFSLTKYLSYADMPDDYVYSDDLTLLLTVILASIFKSSFDRRRRDDHLQLTLFLLPLSGWRHEN